MIIFLVTLALAMLFNFVLAQSPLFWSGEDNWWVDEYIYYTVGGNYVRKGILDGDISAFLENCEHPPLSKLITGGFRILLAPFGLDYYPIPIRLHCAVQIALLSVAIFLLGTRFSNRETGLLAWVLLLGQFYFQRGFTYLSALTHMFWPLASISLTCQTFIALSFYFLYNREQKGHLTLTGFFLGLSALSRFIAIPILLTTTITWVTFKTKNPRLAGEQLLRILLIAGLTLLVGDPLFWNPKHASFLLSTINSKMGWGPRGSTYLHATFIQALLQAKNPPFIVAEALRLAVYILAYPAKLFVSMFLFPLLLVSLPFYLLKTRYTDECILIWLVWLSTTFLFLEILFKRDIIYYPVDLIPPMALLCSKFLIQILRPSKNVQTVVLNT